jgi:hypothetical protein
VHVSRTGMVSMSMQIGHEQSLMDMLRLVLAEVDGAASDRSWLTTCDIFFFKLNSLWFKLWVFKYLLLLVRF